MAVSYNGYHDKGEVAQSWHLTTLNGALIPINQVCASKDSIIAAAALHSRESVLSQAQFLSRPSFAGQPYEMIYLLSDRV